MAPTIQTHTPGVNYIIGYMPHPICQRRPSCALHMEAGHAPADPATLTSQPRLTPHLCAATTAAPYRATPTNGAAGFSENGTA